MTTGTISIVARRPVAAVVTRDWPDSVLATVSIDDGAEWPLPWDEPVVFEVELGEHDVVVNPNGPRPTVDTCCWVDDQGVRLEYVTAYRRSFRGDRIRYLD